MLGALREQFFEQIFLKIVCSLRISGACPILPWWTSLHVFRYQRLWLILPGGPQMAFVGSIVSQRVALEWSKGRPKGGPKVLVYTHLHVFGSHEIPCILIEGCPPAAGSIWLASGEGTEHVLPGWIFSCASKPAGVFSRESLLRQSWIWSLRSLYSLYEQRYAPETSPPHICLASIDWHLVGDVHAMEVWDDKHFQNRGGEHGSRQVVATCPPWQTLQIAPLAQVWQRIRALGDSLNCCIWQDRLAIDERTSTWQYKQYNYIIGHQSEHHQNCRASSERINLRLLLRFLGLDQVAMAWPHT